MLGILKKLSYYGCPSRDSGADDEATRFHHEQLNVYRKALGVTEWGAENIKLQEVPVKTFRRFDALTTSIVLNIAEGNGRFSDADKRTFFETAHKAAIGTAAYCDLCLQKHIVTPTSVAEVKKTLLEVVRMTGGMIQDLL